MYTRIFKESSKDLFIKALKYFKDCYTNAMYDFEKTSKMETSAEVQKYKNKFDSNLFAIQVNGMFNKLKQMIGELPVSFIKNQIKKWNNRSSLSVLAGNPYLSEIQTMIDITEDIIKKL